MLKTALHAEHVDAGAKLVPFAGWEMPLHYGSQVAEHRAVRTSAGMFDVSHMTVFDIDGADALKFLQRVIANDVGRLAPGQAQYGVLLNEEAGVVDDLIAYRMKNGYRVVTNAGTRDRVTAWLTAQAEDAEVEVAEQEMAMLAVQGPEALVRLEAATGRSGLAEIEGFHARSFDDGWLMARTGYTGEDGMEIILPNADVAALWRRLRAAGVTPVGLAARDTLRCEAGLNLYGQDMDETTHPLESNLAWTIAWEPGERQFIGRAALATARQQRKNGAANKLTGIVLDGKGVLRSGYKVHTGSGDGVVTSGIFSPTLEYSIGLARLPVSAKGAAEVEIRGKIRSVRIVKPPFVRHGRKVFL